MMGSSSRGSTGPFLTTVGGEPSSRCASTSASLASSAGAPIGSAGVQGKASNSTRAAAICGAGLLVFLAWLSAPGPSNIGLGFFYAVPIALATWWFGRRGAAIAVFACGVLYCLGALVQPVHEFGF